jgi:asparagine synthase (glutamine-hydrolysing)
MGGIAGLFTVERPVDAGLVAAALRMLDRQVHRGPSDWGILVPEAALRDHQIRSLLEPRGLEHVRTYPGGVQAPAAVLGARRLSILDLSTAGRTPVGTPDGRLWLTYDGEIYNFPELRAELIARGHAFRSPGDTETLLIGYQEWGPEVVDRLRGMFAFAVLDSRVPDDPKLFLARDRFGIKPLYWGRHRCVFQLASEVRALVAGGLMPDEPEPRGFHGFLVHGSVPPPWTTVRDVLSLPAAHSLAVDEVTYSYPRPRRYWSLPEAGSPRISREDAVVEARRLLDEVVQMHLASDAPLGVLLSGGVGSTALVALASRQLPHPLTTLAVTFDGAEPSEGDPAAALARHHGTKHMEVRLHAGDLVAEIPRILAAMDQPTTGGVETSLVAKAAREAGLTVVLSGLGGDEVFRRAPGRGRRREDPGLFSPGQAARLLDAGPLPLTGRASDAGSQSRLLRDTDVFGMAHGLEIRVPFLDHRLAELAFALRPESLPTSVLEEPLLTDAEEDAGPCGIAHPFARWMRAAWDEIERHTAHPEPLDPSAAAAVTDDFRRGRTPWSRAWAVAVLRGMASRGTLPAWRRAGGPRSMLFLMPHVYGTKGGIQGYGQGLLRSAGEAFPRSHLHVLSLNDDRLPPDAPIAGRIHFDGVGPRTRRLLKLRLVWRALKSALRLRPEVIVCGHINLAPLAWGLGRLTGARTALLAYGIEAWSPSRPLRWAAGLFPRILPISRYTGTRMIGWGIPEDRIHVLPNMIDGEVFRPIRRPDSPAARTILTVARLQSSERHKGVDRVLGALPVVAARHPGVRYVVVGGGDDLPRLQRLADDLDISRRVEFRGIVPDHELPLIYAAADVFVMPSVKEGFGFVFIEALACGTPVIAGSRDGSVDALMSGRLGRLVDPEDAAGLAEALVESLGQPDTAAAPARRAEVLGVYGVDRFRARVREELGHGGATACSGEAGR